MPGRPDALAPDLILVNGTIHTVDDANPRATAVAIRDGRFVAVGGRRDPRPGRAVDARRGPGRSGGRPGVDRRPQPPASDRSHVARGAALRHPRHTRDRRPRGGAGARDAAGRVGRRARLGREPSRRRSPPHPPRSRRRLARQPGRHPPRLEQARLQLGGAARGGDRSRDTRSTRRRALQRLIRARRSRASRRGSSGTGPRT